MKIVLRIRLVMCCCLLSISICAQEFSTLFTDHMVLQRDQAINIWGSGNPGSHVEVNLAGVTGESTVAADGHWKVILPKMSAGGPYELSLTSGATNQVLFDVMVGDVWLCSGQSNMEWVVQNSNDADAVIAEASDNEIRHFKVPHGHAWQPNNQLEGGPWQLASSETVASFSAVGYFFAQNIRKHEDVTIGLLNSSWGGSRIEPWMRAELLGHNPDTFAAEMQQKQDQKAAALKENLMARFGELPEEDEGLIGEEAIWASIDHTDDDWNMLEVPGLWEDKGLAGLDGVVWLRKTFELNSAQIGVEASASLGKIDDNDITWINGEKVGETSGYNTDRVYSIPPGLLQEGKNVITVRVEDTGGGGGIWGDASDLHLTLGNLEFSLAGDWKADIGKVTFASAAGINQTPTILYNKMIHPILGFPIKGVLWYQGESNAAIAEAYVYRTLFRDMITDWRELWGIGDFPFLYVQLANFMAADDHPTESGWALLRESQNDALNLPATGQAVIIDIGEADDIHPRNKQDVGYRLALAARKIAYGDAQIVDQGPIYKSFEKTDEGILLHFESMGSSLVAKSKYGYLRGFAIAGADKKFYWARATFVDGGVLVQSDQVADPVAVRYAWGNNPDDANLYNSEGLPASPFRTDEWK